MIFQIIGAFVAVIAFSIVLEAPKKFLVYGGVIGAAGWALYLVVLAPLGIVGANFVAAMMIALLSHTFARVLKAPVTIFLIPGIMTLVPGAGMYRTISEMISGNQEVAMSYLNETISIAGVIALAIFVMDSLFKIFAGTLWQRIKERGPKKGEQQKIN